MRPEDPRENKLGTAQMETATGLEPEMEMGPVMPNLQTTPLVTPGPSVKQRKKHHVVLISVLSAVVLVLGGVLAAWGIWGEGWFAGGVEVASEDTVADTKIANDSATRRPQGILPNTEKTESKLTEVDIDSELVQGVYGNFAAVSSLYYNQARFYSEVGMRGEKVSRGLMKVLAFGIATQDNYSGYQRCEGVYYYTNDTEHTYPVRRCISKEWMDQFTYNVFDEKLTYDDGELLIESDRHICGNLVFNLEHDEFYEESDGCGGVDTRGVNRLLYKAERDANYLYLYEKTLYCGFGHTNEIYNGLKHIGAENVWSGELIAEYDGVNISSDEFDRYISEQGDTFLWTFRKTESGNYVFESLKPVTE